VTATNIPIVVDVITIIIIVVVVFAAIVVIVAVADLHSSKRSSAWGPRTQGAPKFTIKKWLRNNDNAERV